MAPAPRSSAVTRLLRQQAALAHFGSYVFQESSLQNILTEAARICAECLDVPFCKISRFREEHNDFIVEAGYGWNVDVVGQVITKHNNDTPHGRAFIKDYPIITQDLRAEHNIVLPHYYKNHGIISLVDVIIRNKKGLPYGVLEIDSPVLHIYDQHDVDFLTGFANVLAEAVATANRNQTIHTIMVPAHPRCWSGLSERLYEALDVTRGALIQALDGPAPRPFVALA